MKKIYILFAVIVSFLLPLGVMAAVDITMNDTSTDQDYSISVSIDTGIETLDTVVLPIEVFGDVVITDVFTGTVICNSFDYIEQNSILTITCELDNPSSLNGILATIEFTAMADDYSFAVVENDPSLDLGGLSLGTVENIGMAQTQMMPVDDDFIMDDDVDMPFGDDVQDDFFVTDEEGMAPPPDGGIMDFLPYILIGGAVVLLISIVAILLSKKKKKKKPKKGEYTPVDNSPKTDSSAQTQNQDESPLKNMVNNNAPVQDTPTQTQPPIQDTPAPSQPPVQEAPTPAQPTMQGTPIPTAQTTPNIEPANEEQDLQDILKHESSSPDTSVTPEAPPVQPMNQQQATMEPQTIQESSQAPTTPSTTPEETLSSNIAKELNEIQSNPQTLNEGTGVNLQQGIGEQQPNVNNIGDQQQTAQEDTQDENMPPVPPAM